MARQAKITAEAQDLYLRATSAGVPPEVAARNAGFSPATLYRRLQGRTDVGNTWRYPGAYARASHH